MAIQIHEKKYKRQLEGIEKWRCAKDYGSSHSNAWGTLWWCTGVGKTFAACIVINRILKKNSAEVIYIVVPGPDLKKQWDGEIKANIPQEYWANVNITTVESIMNIINNGNRILCGLFIADEVHEYLTEDRLRMFNGSSVVCKWCLGLTATYKDMHDRHKKLETILPVVDRIDEEEASREGFISKYVEYNVAVPFTDKELERYRVLSSIISKNLSKFGHGGLELASKILTGEGSDTPLTMAIRFATARGWRKDLNILNPAHKEILDIWSPQKVIGYAKLSMDSVRERKNLIYNCRNKLSVAKDIVVKFDNLKTICFSQSTSFADMLGKMINDYYIQFDNSLPCVIYHSQLSTLIVKNDKGKEVKKGKIKLKREAIEAIRSGTARIISTASSLDKGFDVKDIRMALTTSGTQNPTKYTQRKGRGLRVEIYGEDIIVLIVNLYVQGTTDEDSLRKRQSESDNIVYWVSSIDDINYSPRINKLINNDLEI